MNKSESDQPTVIFGPFIGEFGWEIMHWMGWVNQMSLTKYSSYKKIVISYPGRSVLYPYADKFIELPKWFLDLKPSARNYILDGWLEGYPGASAEKYVWDFRYALHRILRFRRPHKVLSEKPYAWTSMKPNAELVLSEILEHQGISNYTLICPWKLSTFETEKFGFNDSGISKYLSLESNIYRFPNPNGLWSKLNSTKTGKLMVSQQNPDKQNLITIFPRRRTIRREDKNWGQQNYVNIVEKLQRKYPNHKICICGEPTGAYFAEGVPKYCIDLVNIEPRNRLDAHIAALEDSDIAFGSLSGAMFLPLMTETPTLVFGFESEKARFQRDNYLGTQLTYLAEQNPSVDLIMDEIAKII